MDLFNLGSLVVSIWIVVVYCLPDWKKVVWPKLEKEKGFQHSFLQRSSFQYFMDSSSRCKRRITDSFSCTNNADDDVWLAYGISTQYPCNAGQPPTT